MTRDEARQLERNLIAALRQAGLIDDPRSNSVSNRFANVEISIDYPRVKTYTSHARVPEAERDYGVVVTTGMYRHSTPPRKKRIHRDLVTAMAQIAKEANAHTESLTKRGERLLDKAQKDFDRGWCAHRRGITCKLINGTFHALVRVGETEVWQDDVEYSTSHDTLVFKSEIGKVDRWVTIETLQMLLDRGVLLNPADVKFS